MVRGQNGLYWSSAQAERIPHVSEALAGSRRCRSEAAARTVVILLCPAMALAVCDTPVDLLQTILTRVGVGECDVLLLVGLQFVKMLMVILRNMLHGYHVPRQW